MQLAQPRARPIPPRRPRDWTRARPARRPAADRQARAPARPAAAARRIIGADTARPLQRARSATARRRHASGRRPRRPRAIRGHRRRSRIPSDAARGRRIGEHDAEPARLGRQVDAHSRIEQHLFADADRAAVWRLQAGDGTQQRALAAARMTEHGEGLARWHAERYASEDLVLSEAKREIVDPEVDFRRLSDPHTPRRMATTKQRQGGAQCRPPTGRIRDRLRRLARVTPGANRSLRFRERTERRPGHIPAGK